MNQAGKRSVSSPDDGLLPGNAADSHRRSDGAEATAPDETQRAEAQPDGAEAVILEALRGATAAGRWDVVSQLADELRARRLAVAGNVVPLAGVRSRTNEAAK